MAEGLFVSLKAERGSQKEQALVSVASGKARDQLRMLLGDADDGMVIDAQELSGARPDTSNVGLSVKGVLLDVRFVDTKDGKKMAMVRLLISDNIRSAVQPLDTTKAGDSSLVYMDKTKALCRVDVRYKLSDTDREAIMNRGIKLSGMRKNGNVSVGVKAIYTGMVLSLSMYNVPSIESGGVTAGAGAMLQFNGVQFNLEWNGEAFGDSPSCRASKYHVIKNDDENAMRLAEAMDGANSVPPLNPDAVTSFVMDSWPSGMHVISDEVPAQALAATSNGSSSSSSSVSTVPRIEGRPGSGEVDIAGMHARLEVPACPLVFMGFNDAFVAHLGESEQQTLARLEAGSTAGVPTMFRRAVLSTDTDSIQYEDNNQKKCVRAKYAVFFTQIIRSKRVAGVIHCTTPKDGPVHMLTGTVNHTFQEAVLPAMIAGLAGPMLIEPKLAGEHDFESEFLKNALNMTSYVSTIPPLVLQMTVPRAGFQVSADWMRVERAICSRTVKARTDAMNSSALCTYYMVDGPPTENSRVLMLNTSGMGYYDEASHAKLVAKMAPVLTSGSEKQRQTVAPLVESLTGPLCAVAKSHDFFVVGKIVPTVEVMEHQAEMRERDLDALLKGNEWLMATGNVPDWFPGEVYEAAKQSSTYTAKVTGHYAVIKSMTDGSFVRTRMKRQLDNIAEGAKRPSIMAAESNGGCKYASDHDDESDSDNKSSADSDADE